MFLLENNVAQLPLKNAVKVQKVILFNWFCSLLKA